MESVADTFSRRQENLTGSSSSHQSVGVDLVGRNSALQVVPNEESSAKSPVSLTLHRVDLTSFSGRGILVKGERHSRVEINNSFIHGCASTAVHLDGANSELVVRDSDIVGNAQGCRSGGSLQLGDAPCAGGIHVEQGSVHMHNSLVAWNCGIGMVVESQCTTLDIQETEITENLHGNVVRTSSLFQQPLSTAMSARTNMMPQAPRSSSSSSTTAVLPRARSYLMKRNQFDGRSLIACVLEEERREQELARFRHTTTEATSLAATSVPRSVM